ncbi:putative coniferyl aldehyde dehydrogenase [Chitinimonas prasina]|uniref:Aldehyde dehydrogenase n=1 Tax=Chitinimonas prasina TaxID=1434937 RepID=A0ABQ5YKL6_9NEIS|nr:coniferyl aldehyde dehydrogenase [Chitinimonas prasina]GLR14509.1 putative coniferyl aldehyde dehydrogenase [Chitinimonas prasina]
MQAQFEPHETQAELAHLRQVYQAQREAYAAMPYPPEALRRDRLNRLRHVLQAHGDEIAAAISADFGHRSAHETRLLEIFPSLGGVDHALAKLGRWMKPRRRGVSIWFKPASNRVVPQPLGVVGIIVPWNYPLFLAVGPLTAALAAGNRAVVKISEFTPRLGETFRRLIGQYFDENEVAVINGGAEVAQVFSGYAWDHMLFTGSTSVGKHVMRAAADNLTPVTLELGGKSPTIVHESFPIQTAAERVMYGKCLNAGQTCVAPDYVLLPEGKQEAFLAAAREVVGKWYPDAGRNPDYTAVVNGRHLNRLQGYLKDAAEKGARVVPLAEVDPATGKLAPTLVFDTTEQMTLLQDEIFGPILPVLTYKTLDEAIDYVNTHPRPLALYYFDYDNQRISQVISNTISGGVGVNETVMHVGQDDLPFGGVGPSGMGHYHGHEGFETFSKMKPIFAQSRFNGAWLLRPPYGPRVERLLKFMLR